MKKIGSGQAEPPPIAIANGWGEEEREEGGFEFWDEDEEAAQGSAVNLGFFDDEGEGEGEEGAGGAAVASARFGRSSSAGFAPQPPHLRQRQQQRGGGGGRAAAQQVGGDPLPGDEQPEVDGAEFEAMLVAFRQQAAARKR